MKTEKLLTHFLTWIDDSTFWKEDNDIPNHFIVNEYLKSYPENQSQPIEKEQEILMWEGLPFSKDKQGESETFDRQAVKSLMEIARKPLEQEIERMKNNLECSKKVNDSLKHYLAIRDYVFAESNKLKSEIDTLQQSIETRNRSLQASDKIYTENKQRIKDQEQEIERLKTDTSGLERLTVKYQERIAELEAQLKECIKYCHDETAAKRFQKALESSPTEQPEK